MGVRTPKVPPNSAVFTGRRRTRPGIAILKAEAPREAPDLRDRLLARVDALRGIETIRPDEQRLQVRQRLPAPADRRTRASAGSIECRSERRAPRACA